MGMFDYTYHQCPKCQIIVENQSKAASCSLNRYYFGNIKNKLPILNNEHTEEQEEYLPVPLSIIQEAEQYGLKCNNCGYKTELLQTPYYLLN